MPEVVTIAGEDVSLVWNIATQRNLPIRASKAGLAYEQLLRDFQKPRKAEYAVTAMLWLLLPDTVYRKYETPEDLFSDLNDDDAEKIVTSILEVLSSAAVDAEKKNRLLRSHSPELNSEPLARNGTRSTQPKRTR